MSSLWHPLDLREDWRPFHSQLPYVDAPPKLSSLALFTSEFGCGTIQSTCARSWKEPVVPDWSNITNLVMRTPKGEYITAGTETDAFVAHGTDHIEVKPGVKITEEPQPGGRAVYRFTSETGDPMGSAECRCPAGYGGGCMKSWTEGNPNIRCGGTCTHTELPGMTTPCGWFTTGPKQLFGRFRFPFG